MRKKKVFLTLIASALFVSCLTSCNDEKNGNNVNNSADNSSSVTQSVPSNNDSDTNQQSNSNSNTQTQNYNISANDTSKKVFDELAKISSDITYEDFLKNGTFDDKGIISEFKYKSMTIDIKPDGTFYYLTKYTYDDNNNELLYEESKYINDSWVLTIKKEYFENSNVVKFEKHYRFDSNGVYTNLQETSYDENGKMQTEKTFKYVNDAWVKVLESKNFGSDRLEPIYILVLNDDGTYNTLEESTYDEKNIITTTKSKYINDSWVKIEEKKWKRNADGSSGKVKLTYYVAYNEDGSFKSSVESIIDDNFNVLTYINSVYSQGEWIYESKTEYTYDADGNEVAVTSYDYVDNKWDKTKESIRINGSFYDTYIKNYFYIYEYTYDEDANILTTDISIKIDDNWVKYQSSKVINGQTKTIYWLHIIYENEFDYSDEYEYDEQANIKTHIQFRYKDNKINSGSKYEYEYDEKNNETLEIYYSYKNGEWIPSDKKEYEYNAGNHKTLFVRSEYKDGEWVYKYKFEYIFDKYGNQTGTLTYVYENGEWVKQ